MSADENRPQLRPSSRPVERATLPDGPARVLRDAVYLLYGEAGCPRLDDVAAVIADDDMLPGAPGKDAIGKVIAGEVLGSQQDIVSVAVVLARAAGRPADPVASQVRQLWAAAWTAPPPPQPVQL